MKIRCGLILFIILIFTVSNSVNAQTTNKISSSLKKALTSLSASDIPPFGPSEKAVPLLSSIVKTNLVLDHIPGNGLAQHPMLYIGEGYNTIFIVKDGKIIWTYSTGSGFEFDDIWLLSNGNVLFSRMSYAEEVTPQKKVVWHLDAPKGTEIHSLQPIGLDKVFVMQNGPTPKIIIINKKTGAIEVDHELVAPGASGPGSVHGQFRRGRVTANGTYLVSWLSLGKVVEYDKEFKEIWSYATPKPWAAIRLKNGNTLITDEDLMLTREVNPKGENVWEYKLKELPSDIPFINCQSCIRLANGNTIFCSRGDGGKGCQLVEITPDKKVVWALYDWQHLGPATAIQALDDPGIPEKPGDLQR